MEKVTALLDYYKREGYPHQDYEFSELALLVDAAIPELTTLRARVKELEAWKERALPWLKAEYERQGNTLHNIQMSSDLEDLLK